MNEGGNCVLDIEKATEVLEEAVITEPSIKSYVYISAGEINQAIEIVLQELQRKEEKIKELNQLLFEKTEEQNKSLAVGLLEKIGRTMILEKSI